MGAFALCIENATRDIHSLLTLHRVHPQVHADIQRILSSLLRKQYTDMTVQHSPELADAPEQVCRALVESIVERTINTAIPAANLVALEKRCMRLEEDKSILEAEAVKTETQLAEMQTVLHNLKEAHDYMLHSYFREVLTLRSRIDDLQWQNRAYRTQASAAAAAAASVGASAVLSTSMGSQLQQFVLNSNPVNSSNNLRKDSVASKRLGADEVLQLEAAAAASESSVPSTFSSAPAATREGKSDKAEGASCESSPTRRFSDTHRGSTNGESLMAPTPAAFPAASTAMIGHGAASMKNSSASPRGKDRSVRIASPFPNSPRGQNMTMQTATATAHEALPLVEPESIDAIFDYEEYIRILNGERGSWAKRFVAVMNEPDTGVRRRRRSMRIRTRMFSDVNLRGSGPFQEVEMSVNQQEQQGQQQETKIKGFQWLLHLALEPIQHKFHAELDQLRQAVHMMQKEHARDVQAIARALAQVQNRNDALLDFLETFVQDTKRTISVLSRDSRAHTISDLLLSGTLPVERADNTATFFTPSATPSFGFGSPMSSPPPLTQLAEMSGDANAAVANEPSMARTASPHSLHPRKVWRLKPDARLTVEKRTAATRATDRRLKLPDMSKAAAVTTVPPEPSTAENYYRADLGLPYWSSHPITMHAQEVFGELQLAAKEMRITRVQQLYALEEAVAARSDGNGAGGRRVRFKQQRDGSAAATSAGRQHRSGSTSSAPVEKTPDSFDGMEVEGSGSLGESSRPRKRLQEGWWAKTIIEGDDATVADLLQELVHLRMRRACDHIRLTRVQEAILRTFYPDQADHKTTPTIWTKSGKQGRAPGAMTTTSIKKLKLAEMPPVNFKAPEEVLKHRALQKLRSDTQKRIGATSQRIQELQRLLAVHLAENEVQVVDYAGSEADEEAAGMYRVNGELKSTQQLWSSPYLNDSNGPYGVLYLPIGPTSTVDAVGSVGGGAGAVVKLGDTSISVAPFAATPAASQIAAAATTSSYHNTTQRKTRVEDNNTDVADNVVSNATIDEDVEAVSGETPTEARNTPYVAVMDYCRGVQLGRPVGHRGGPVYLFQDANTGEYYVGDAAGRPAIAGDNERSKKNRDGTSTGDLTAADVDRCRPPLAMTRILFPAPLQEATPSNNITTINNEGDDAAFASRASPAMRAPPAASSVPARTTSSSSSIVSPVALKALQPLYLVPMAIPLSDDEAIIRAGWQACHRHGHTRQDPIFYATLSPLPLSSSYHHVVPQRGNLADGQEITTNTHGYNNTNISRYLVDPPRVFQPVDEASSMVRVRAMRLQSRNVSSNAPRGGVTAETGGRTDKIPPPSPSLLTHSFVVSSAAQAENKNNLLSTDAAIFLSESTNPDVAASPADKAFIAPTATVASPTSVQPLLFASGSAQPSSLPLEPLPASPNEAAATGITLQSSAASTPVPHTLLRNENAGPAATAPLTATSSSSAAAAATSSASSMSAALLFAKQQRATRLAKEAEAERQLKTQRQGAWHQQRLGARVPVQKEASLRLPHLTPLPTHGTETNTSLLPSAASSARLQRQMRPEKYALGPPPPSSSRRAELSKRSSSEWNFKDDA